jgi:hypothetical protein
MIPRFKKDKKPVDLHLTKEQFLWEHNKLSPEALRATIPLLSRFREDKTSLFKNDGWSLDKLRRPFISWLTSLPQEEKEKVKKKKNEKLS